MKKITRFGMMGFLIVCSFISCSKELSRGSSNEIEYIAGWVEDSVGILPVLWTNRSFEKLTTNLYGEAIEVVRSGNDVYVCGILEYNGVDEAVIWKNGQIIRLSPGVRSGALSVATYNSDVFVAGVKYLDNIATKPRPVLWKNGNETILSSGSNAGEAVKVKISSNGDVYVGGIETISSRSTPTIWKNLQPIRLADPNVQFSHLSDFYIHQTDIYAVSSSGNYPSCTIWKNGIKQITHNDRWYRSILVDSLGNRYNVGDGSVNSLYTTGGVGFWKNDTRLSLGQNYWGSGNMINYFDNKFYIVGMASNDSTGKDAPFVWSDSQMRFLSYPSNYGDGCASSILLFKE